MCARKHRISCLSLNVTLRFYSKKNPKTISSELHKKGTIPIKPHFFAHSWYPEKYVTSTAGAAVHSSHSGWKLFTHLCEFADVQPGHLFGGKRSCKWDIWKASPLSVTWCGAASCPSGWTTLRTGCSGTAFHLSARARQTDSQGFRAPFFKRKLSPSLRPLLSPTCVAALVYHQHIGPDADHAAHLALELSVGQADGPGRGRLGTGHVTINTDFIPTCSGVLCVAFLSWVSAVLPPALIPHNLSILWLRSTGWLIITVQFHLNGVGCAERGDVRKGRWMRGGKIGILWHFSCFFFVCLFGLALCSTMKARNCILPLRERCGEDGWLLGDLTEGACAPP